MNFSAHQYYKPVLSPNNKYAYVCGAVLDQAMGGAYKAAVYIWQKGSPVFQIHDRAAGLGVWNLDSESIYFPIWINTTEGHLNQKLASYQIKNGVLSIYEKEYDVLSLNKIENNSISATLSPLFQPENIEINIKNLSVESTKMLPFKYHEAYYDFEHPILSINNTEYNNAPNHQIFVQYCLRCHVQSENDKIFYNKQMMQLYQLLRPIIAPWKFKRVATDVAKFRAISKKPNANGAVRITGKPAPNGGTRNVFTEANFHKVSTLHLSPNTNLVNSFNLDYDQGLIYLKHPEGLPNVFKMEIYGRKNNIKTPNWTYDYCTPMHFFLYCDNYLNHNKNEPHNQRINIWMPRNLMPQNAMDQLIRQIGQLAFATQIHKSETAWSGITIEAENGNIAMNYRINENIEEAINGENKYGLPWQEVPIK
jgi:hypothetical protein